MDQEGWGVLPGTGVYAIYVGFHRRKTTGNRLCPACRDSRKGCLGGGMACCSTYGLS